MYALIIFIIIIIAIMILFRQPKAGKDGVVKYGEYYSNFKSSEFESYTESQETLPQVKPTHDKTPNRAATESVATPIPQSAKESEKYAEFISNIYKANGYVVLEYSKEREQADKPIDLIAKKDNKIVFIVCKNRNSSSYNIKEIDLKATRIDVIDYLEQYPQFQPYKYKILYIATEDIFDLSAKQYVKQKNHIIELKIIPHQKV